MISSIGIHGAQKIKKREALHKEKREHRKLLKDEERQKAAFDREAFRERARCLKENREEGILAGHKAHICGHDHSHGHDSHGNSSHVHHSHEVKAGPSRKPNQLHPEDNVPGSSLPGSSIPQHMRPRQHIQHDEATGRQSNRNSYRNSYRDSTYHEGEMHELMGTEELEEDPDFIPERAHVIEKKANDFTEEEQVGIQAAFFGFDKDHSGGITVEELLKVLTQDLGSNDISEEDCRVMIDEFDKDGNGVIDTNEFMELLLTLIGIDDTEEELVQSFALFDSSESGTLNLNSLKRVMCSIGDALTADEMEDMVKDVHADAEGNFNYAEFSKMIMESIA